MQWTKTKKGKKPNTYKVESRLFEPLRETRIGSKNRIQFQKSGVKSRCSIEERETTFGSSYRAVKKNEGSRNRDSALFYKHLEWSIKPRDLLLCCYHIQISSLLKVFFLIPDFSVNLRSTLWSFDLLCFLASFTCIRTCWQFPRLTDSSLQNRTRLSYSN